MLGKVQIKKNELNNKKLMEKKNAFAGMNSRKHKKENKHGILSQV